MCYLGVISVFAATIEPAGRHELTHGAYCLVAFGERGDVVLDDAAHIYLYHYAGMQYNLARKTWSPEGVRWNYYKAVSEATIFLQQEVDGPTHQLSIRDLHHIGRLHHKGALNGAIYPNTLVYLQKRADDDWFITLHQPNGEVILQPPPGRTWGEELSVCRAGGCIVVVEIDTETMDVFATNGNILLLFCNI